MEFLKKEKTFLVKMLKDRIVELERINESAYDHYQDVHMPNFTEESFIKLKSKNDKEIAICKSILERL